jgi:hypothetical protein
MSQRRARATRTGQKNPVTLAKIAQNVGEILRVYYAEYGLVGYGVDCTRSARGFKFLIPSEELDSTGTWLPILMLI